MSQVIFIDNGTEVVADVVLGIAGSGGPVTATGFYMGWGTGGTTSASATADKTTSSVDLSAEATETRVSCTGESQSAGDTNQWIGRLTTTTSKTIEEFGLFINASTTATDALVLADHGSVALATDDIIEYTCTLQFI